MINTMKTFSRSRLSTTITASRAPLLALGPLIVAAGYPAVCAAADPLLESKNFIFDEVVVTARKIEENLMDVPIAISAVTEKELTARGVNEVADLTKSVPNFTGVASSSSIGGMGMRGIVSVTRNVGFESGMGVYVDQVYVGRPAAFNQNLADIAQVEVLRGPQGTLFGRNTIAGAINITTKKPSDEVEGRVKATAANFETYNLSASVMGPLMENSLYGKINVYSHNRNQGYVDNLAADKGDLGEDRTRGFRAGLRWEARDDLEISLDVDSMKGEGASTVFNITEVGSNAPGPFAVLPDYAGEANVTAQNEETLEERDVSGSALRLVWDINDELTLTSVTAYREVNLDLAADNDSRDLPLSSSTFLDDSSQFTQEVRLQGDIADGWDYMLGLYYLKQEASAIRATTVATPPFTRVMAPLYPGFLVGEINNAGNAVQPFGVLSSDAKVDSEAYALFASSNYDLTDALTLNVGLRYTLEEKTMDFFQDNTSSTLHPQVFSTPEIDDEAWSGNLSLTYALDNMTLYGSASRGFKSGGFNPDIIPSSDEIQFGSEKVWSYEVGVKSDMADGRVRMNAALFFTDYEDLQVQRLAVTPVGPGFAITNADKAEIWGVEAEIQVRPIEGLDLSAGIGYIEPEYKKFPNCASGAGGMNPVDCDGKQLNYAAKMTGSASAQYGFSVGDAGAMYLRADWSYRDESFSEPTNVVRSRVESYDVIDVRLGFRSNDERWELALWGKNLADDEYELAILTVPSFDNTFSAYNIGRTYGVDFIYNL